MVAAGEVKSRQVIKFVWVKTGRTSGVMFCLCGHGTCACIRGVRGILAALPELLEVLLQRRVSLLCTRQVCRIADPTP